MSSQSIKMSSSAQLEAYSSGMLAVASQDAKVSVGGSVDAYLGESTTVATGRASLLSSELLSVDAKGLAVTSSESVDLSSAGDVGVRADTIDVNSNDFRLYSTDVELISASGMRADAQGPINVQSQDGLAGRFAGAAEIIVGKETDLYSLGAVGMTSAGDTQFDGLGDLEATVQGQVQLHARSARGAVDDDAALAVAGDVSMVAGGGVELAATFLDSQIAGDINTTSARAQLAVQNQATIDAGRLEVRSVRGVHMYSKGASIDIGASDELEFAPFLWKAPLSFNTFENMLPEAMSDILELSVRAAGSNSQAFIRLTGGSSAEVSLDIATESSGAVEWVEVWNEKVQANSTLFDGLHVRLAAPTAISGFRLRTTPNALFEGSDKLTFSMGRQVSLVRVASGSDMDATASKTMSMSAQSVLVNAAKTMDVSVSGKYCKSRPLVS